MLRRLRVGLPGRLEEPSRERVPVEALRGVYIYVCIYIYIHIERERDIDREREKEIEKDVYK